MFIITFLLPSPNNAGGAAVPPSTTVIRVVNDMVTTPSWQFLRGYSYCGVGSEWSCCDFKFPRRDRIRNSSTESESCYVDKIDKKK